MADPATVAAVGIGANAGGSIFSAFGASQQGQAQSNLFRYQAGVAQLNKQIADQNASYAIAAGETEAQQSGMQTRFQIGQTKASQGASGLDVNRGSAVEVRASEAEIGAENQALIRSNAGRVAYGFETQAAGDVAQANIDTMAASESKIAAQYNVASSLLGGASSVSSKWLQASEMGVFGA